MLISLSIAWKLALLCIATVPILLACGYFRYWILASFQGRSRIAYEKSAAYACEATSAIRTVATLCREEDILHHYGDQVRSQQAKSLRSTLRSSTLYALSQSLGYLCNGFAFWYGGTLISSREYDLFRFFICFAAVIFGAQAAGQVFSRAPDIGKAKNAALDIKKLFDV